MSDRVREIYSGDDLIAHVYNFTLPGGVIFPTPAETEMQCGFGQIDEDKAFKPHVHKILERTTVNTSEFIYIIEGEMRVDFLNDDDEIVGTAILTSGQGMLQFIGGHRITMDAKTKYFELKQGPYFGHIDDKRIVEGQLEHAKAI